MRGSRAVVAMFVLVSGAAVYACGGQAIVDPNARPGGLGESGGTAGTSSTPSSGGTTSSAQGGSSEPSMGTAGTYIGTPMPGTGGASPMPGVGGTVATGGWQGTGGTAVSSGGSHDRDPQCLGIQRNMPCPIEGYMCPDLRCGIADQGMRTCACAGGIWACTSCDFSGSIIQNPPVNPANCTTQADEVYCETEWEVCVGAPGGEVCVCYVDDQGARVWDCDDPPGSWP